MIQRQQTLWLMLATICALLTFQFPFLTGVRVVGTSTMTEELDAGSNLYLLLLTVACIILSTVSIFLFKDRKSQSRLTLVGLILSVVLLIMYIVVMQEYAKTTLALYCILPLLIIVGFIMAYRGIRHDQNLVKSLNKLR